eukprot:783545-Prymnesium_polylepis.1
MAPMRSVPSQDCVQWVQRSRFFYVEAEAECAYDYVEIAGDRFCGISGPVGVVPTDGMLRWVSDIIETEAGWEICLRRTRPARPPLPPPPAPPVPPHPPLAPP